MELLPAIFCLLVAVSSITAESVEMTPREAVRTQGGEVTVLCKVAYPISSCRFMLGGNSYILDPKKNEGDVIYAGEGLNVGECGAHIKNIREEWHGNVICSVPPQTGNIEVSSTMRLIVARPPKEPILQSGERGVQLREGDALTAACIVPMGRPAAKISWLLDGEPLLSGLHAPVSEYEGASDFVTISQNVTKLLAADDSGKTLSCVAEHEAWNVPKQANLQLIVHFPPKPQDGDSITIFGLKLSEEGRINVTVRANPPPEVVWTIRDETLRPGQTDMENNIVAEEPKNLGQGYYNCTLVVRRLTKEDVEKQYYLTVSNELGEQKLSIRISTMDEPAGVELEAGAIVGIVIAVLVLLIAITLIVFAKATDRWCFAERRREVVKNSGESTPAAGDVLLESGLRPATGQPSDTESANGGRMARWRFSELRDRVRNALPRHKDKVQAADQGPEDDKATSDEKKGVVYAELALGEQPASKPTPPPSTEYAEIVYTNPPPAEGTPENK